MTKTLGRGSRRGHWEPRPALGKWQRPLSPGQWIVALFVVPTLSLMLIALVALGFRALLDLAS
jgi:hypothetical protein